MVLVLSTKELNNAFLIQKHVGLHCGFKFNNKMFCDAIF